MNPELVKVAKEIKKKIKEMENKRARILPRSKTKSDAVSHYDKMLAKTIMMIVNGKEVEIDGVKIQSPIGGLVDKIARGVCWKEKLDLDSAECAYKSVNTHIEAIKAELNGYQSINKHLDEV